MSKVKGNWGCIFRCAMNEQNISSDKLSIGTQIPKRTIQAYLSDTVEPSATNFLKITKFLNITL